MATILAIVSGKGGVGKTTVTANLAASLGARGLRVLAVDLDGQGHLALALGVPRNLIGRSVADVLRDDCDITDVILRTVAPGVDLAPATTAVFDAGEELRDRTRRFRVLRLRLQAVAADYDLIAIDSPPALGFHTTSALTAADFVLLPTPVSGFALSGVNAALELIRRVAREDNPRLRLLGLLPTFLDTRVGAHREVLRALHRLVGVPRLEAVIPYDHVFSESSLLGLPVMFHAPDSAGARAFSAAASEVEARVAAAGRPLPAGRAPVATAPLPPLTAADLETRGLRPGGRGRRWWRQPRGRSTEGL